MQQNTSSIFMLLLTQISLSILTENKELNNCNSCLWRVKMGARSLNCSLIVSTLLSCMLILYINGMFSDGRLAWMLRYTRAALVIQKTYRMVKVRQFYLTARKATITIQAFTRGMQARRAYRMVKCFLKILLNKLPVSRCGEHDLVYNKLLMVCLYV